jgi:hypothetical protein
MSFVLGVVTIALMSTSASWASSTSKSPARARQELAAATREWTGGASAFSYDQSVYLRHAATYLSRALLDAVSDAARYETAIRQLRQLASLPETGDSPSQRSEARRDLTSLNLFFHTKNLYE